ncbi:MAG: gas vesicle protein GvpG [Cyclobacteriaceae bacterium]
MFILDDIILSPIKGIFSLAKVINDRVQEELYNPEKIQEDLMQLQLKFELDQISEEEYDALEEDLLARLSESKKRMRSNPE